jgi:hypothetical protein
MDNQRQLTIGAGWKSLRLGSARYVVEAGGREALYDLSRDPDAYQDVADDPAYGGTLARARHELLKRLLVRERPGPRVWPY